MARGEGCDRVQTHKAKDSAKVEGGRGHRRRAEIFSENVPCEIGVVIVTVIVTVS
jgi:hypothetical protein